MKNFTVLLLTGFLGILTACGEGENREENQYDVEKQPEGDSIVVTLEEVWSTDNRQLLTPEAVTYDPGRKLFYVSNLNRDNETENDGYISIVNLDGSLKKHIWIKGLISPLGNDFYQEHLYVNDKENIVKINIETGEIVERIRIEGATGLNGIDIDDTGNIYCADSQENKIFKVDQNHQISVLFEGEELNRPNGLLIKDDELIVASSGGNSLKSIDLNTKKLNTLVEGIGQADGIILLRGGHYLTSSWTGEIYFITNDMKKQKILDTKQQEVNAADIAFVPEENLLIVPTFYDNRLVAYKLNIQDGKGRNYEEYSQE